MGQLLYGSPAEAFEIDDRALAHLQVVIVNKFRRNESFAMSLDIETGAGEGVRADAADGAGAAARESMWMHPAIQLRFRFSEEARPAVNRSWCEALMTEANSGRGLSLIGEPEAPAPIRSVAPQKRPVAA